MVGGLAMRICTWVAPASRTMVTIFLLVVPRTMESSTRITRLPLSSALLALCFLIFVPTQIFYGLVFYKEPMVQLLASVAIFEALRFYRTGRSVALAAALQGVVLPQGKGREGVRHQDPPQVRVPLERDPEQHDNRAGRIRIRAGVL